MLHIPGSIMFLNEFWFKKMIGNTGTKVQKIQARNGTARTQRKVTSCKTGISCTSMTQLSSLY